MNSWLIDTNVLLRVVDPQSREHAAAKRALATLIERADALFITLQVLIEFWAVATRPANANGLGWSTASTASAIRTIRDQFPSLQDVPDIADRWLDLVTGRQVSGKRTHDARLAAVLLVHRIDNLLTFNTADFPPDWGIRSRHPEEIL